MENNDNVIQPQINEERRFLAIEDEAEWLRRYGLNGEPHYGEDSYFNQHEMTQRIKAAQTYQASVHAKLFDDDRGEERKRQAQLDEWRDQIVQISTGTDNSYIEYNLCDLASQSDTIYTMAISRPHFDVDAESPLQIALEEYSYDTVSAFLELLSAVSSKGIKGFDTAVIDDDHVVDWCRIGNFLQCRSIMDDILVPLLIQSVDSANCLSLCQLADQLNLPPLLEASVNHMMLSLSSVEEHEVWGDLTPELRSRIDQIQEILQTSNRRQLFFSSFEEYLALFAEQVEYYRERLEDAVQQQSLQDKNSPSWSYTQRKIEQQQDRVRVLKLMLVEQKKIFRPDN